MPEYDLVYLAELITVTFCALIFSVLAVFFLREKRFRKGSVFAVFTLGCAAAFLLNLALRIAPQWGAPLTLALDAVTGFLPALLFHLVSQGRNARVRTAFYGLSAVVAVALSLDDAGVISVSFTELAPGLMLAAAGVLGLAFLAAPDAGQRAWYRWLLVLTIAATVTGMIYRSPATTLAPDYLLLGFFCTTLYYQERLIFFDLLLKRGAFFCLALAALTLFFVVRRSPEPLVTALLLIPLWLIAPWADACLGRIIDRTFLRRRYSPSEAERLLTRELQLASTEDDLRSRAEACLAGIFQAGVRVRFESGTGGWTEDPHSMMTDLEHRGWAGVERRRSGIPFMSDDRRLFQSLTATLGVVLENVRFREQQRRQQEREEQLRLLASRAELKVLRAQINPHFLFNALNAIAGLIPSQPELADQTIEQLAQVFRYALRKSATEWVRLDEEVEFVAAYLRVEQARFGDRLEVELAVSPEAGVVPVPAMCIQPLVENALRHGISSLAGRGRVRLSVAIENDMLNIQVYDNGHGFPHGFVLADSSGHALRNIAGRLTGYYGDAAGLSWDRTDNGARVSLRIPCQPPGEGNPPVAAGREKCDSNLDRG